MLSRAGVPYTTDTKVNGLPDAYEVEGTVNVVIINEQYLSKARGYGGFFCEFVFDENDTLKEVGVWE